MALDLAQLQAVLDSATKADSFKADVKRALKKISTSLAGLQTSLDEANALLSDDYTPAKKERKARAPRELGEADPSAPYGKKADGTPKSKPGRSKANTTA